MNMGNLAFAGNRMEDALDYYTRADRKRSGKPIVVLNLARANYELRRYEQVEKYYGQLLSISERMAEKYSYLDMKKGDSTSRASESGMMKGEMVWYEE
jgi:tetratricopeptide (TPR) repeat protein